MNKLNLLVYDGLLQEEKGSCTARELLRYHEVP